MKHIFTKIGAVVLALFTLVSCNSKDSKYPKSHEFEYANQEELKTALANATLYENAPKTGVYLPKIADTQLKPDELTIKVFNKVTKEDYDSVTKDALKISINDFVIEYKLTYNDEKNPKKKTVYCITVRNTYAEDIYPSLISEEKDPNKKLYIGNDEAIYEDVDNNVMIGYVDKTDPKDIKKYRFIEISTTDKDSIQTFSMKFMSNLEYVQLGK